MGRSTRDRRDIYYRRAKEEGWRARSAFKLLQIDAAFDIFSNVTTGAVDLCAAPGSWSQVLAERLPEGAKIVSVDLQPMAPLNRVTIIEGDITKPAVAAAILDHFPQRSAGDRPSLVVCDGAPDVTGMHDVDQFVQSQLLLAALALAVAVLAPGGTFVAKIFRGRDSDLLFAQLRVFFPQVTCVKPKSSRGTSVEAFVVCQNFTLPDGFRPDALMQAASLGTVLPTEVAGADAGTGLTPVESALAPFVSAGDASGLDSDCRYAVTADHVSKRPVAPPTEPAYRRAKELRRLCTGTTVTGDSSASSSAVGTFDAAEPRLLQVLADREFLEYIVHRDMLRSKEATQDPAVQLALDATVAEAKARLEGMAAAAGK